MTVATLLAIDTAFAALSVALFDGDHRLAAEHQVIGRGHAEALMPMVARVMAAAGARTASRVLVTVGPGSFTGLRVGIAAARALGLAWQAPVAGTTATALIAAAAFAADPALARVAAVAEVGRGQFCVEVVGRDDWPMARVPVALDPAAAAHAAAGMALAGPAAAAVAAFGLNPAVYHGWPDAADALRVPAAARALPPLPLYVRPPDARLPL